MAYPDEKVTFRRVVGENLAEGIAGDTIKSDDHNNKAEVIENIEDTLGLNPEGSEATVRARLDAIETALGALKLVEMPIRISDVSAHVIDSGNDYTKSQGVTLTEGDHLLLIMTVEWTQYTNSVATNYLTIKDGTTVLGEESRCDGYGDGKKITTTIMRFLSSASAGSHTINFLNTAVGDQICLYRLSCIAVRFKA